MENIQQKDKKNKLPLIAMLASMLVCCIIFAVLCLTGIIPVKTGIGYIDMRTAALVKQTTEVSDEDTLRELLLLKKELSIVVTEDIKIDETFVVKGKKTLYGNATISADVAGEYRTMYIFDVQPGASLTMNGLVLDGDGTADGINVGQDAELTYLSGTIQYMRYGIQTNGKVHFEDGLIQHSTQAGILSSYRSKVYVNGGHIYNANNHLIHVDTNGYVEINEGADLSVCRGDAVFNAGTLHVYGGTIHDTVARAINTEGELHMEYKGSEKDGYIEMYNIGSIAVRMNAHDDCYISDVHAVNIGTNGVFTTDLRSNGKTTVENCIFDTCAIVEGNGMSVSRKVEINDVTILNSQGGGINVRENGDVKIDGVTIDGTKGDGITIGAELEAKNVRLANVQANNIEIITGVEATITDSVLEKSKRTSVYMRKESTLTLDNVEVQGVVDEALFNFHVNEGSVLNLKGDTSITGATRVAICLYKNTTLNMEDGKIFGINGTDNGAGVWIREEGAVFNMTGGSIEGNTTTGSSGGVFVANKTTFNMSGGKITGNSAKYSGGGVQVQGVMNFSGGTISNNKAETTGGGINVGNNASKGIFGKLNMTGGTIENNYAVSNGGGISVSGKTTVNISGGTIKGNKADGLGNGIADNGNLTLSGKVAVTGNDVGLVSRDIILKIKGNTLSKHSASNPLLVTPHFKTKPNQYVVIECDDEAAASAMLNKYVKSGNEVYTLIQNTKKTNQIVVDVNNIVMDLNTTGAETVYVSNFQELKEAVETTKTKRNIVIGADIVMESLITVPAGTVVNIRDDGYTRTLTRNAGHATLFFETWYGTGLVLEGTSEGKLVLDGKTSGEVNLKNVNSLVKVRGTSEFTNVAFKDNGNTTATLSGAFVNSEFGTTIVDSCTFTNGIAVNGGAIYSTANGLTVKDSTFTSNTAKERGGAIFNAKTTAVVENTAFKDNTAVGSGGAIHNANSGQLTLKGTTTNAIFEGNNVTGGLEKDNYGGGALCVGTGNVTIEGYTFKNNVTENSNGGAIELNSAYTTASITDCTFDTNSTANQGGAIWSKAKLTAETTSFVNNKADAQGGAVVSQGKTVVITDCEFDGNTAKGNGGALYSGNHSDLTLTSTGDAVFKNNTSSGNGGAICIGSGTVELAGYTFTGNTANNGGAIRFNSDEITAEVRESVFVNNDAKAAGGAISSAAKTEAEGDVNLLVSGCTFGRVGEGNSAPGNGGALSAMTGVTVVENTTFTDNKSTAGKGGAIYGGDNGTLKLNGKKDANALFEGNTSTGFGGAIGVGSGKLEIVGYTFDGNNSDVEGGAVALDASPIAAQIKDSVFVNNSATSGGAIYNTSTKLAEDKSNLLVTGCTFGKKDAGNSASVQGGAIYTKTGVATIENSSFTANEAVGNGGAIYNAEKSTLTLKGTDAKALFDTNISKEGTGGAIGVGTGHVEITGYTFDNNESKLSDGGAIRFNSAEITAEITDSVFVNNKANKTGGAISNAAKTAAEGDVNLLVSGCTFGKDGEGNSASGNGGAISAMTGVTTVENTTFTDNVSTGGNGGAIYSGDKGTLTLTGTSKVALFEGNTSTKGTGGAIGVGSGHVEITGYTFSDNNAGGQGGAIYLKGSLTLKNTDFDTNKSGSTGGAIHSEGGTMQATSCDFTSNEAADMGGACRIVAGGSATFDGTGQFKSNKSGTVGGAIQTNTAKVSITGYTFEGNSAKDGGAVYVNPNGNIIFTGSTFTNNQATSGDGGAIYNASTKTGTDAYALTVDSCTFGGNTAAGVKNGIYDNGNLTIKGAIYMANDEIELAYGKVLTIEGTALSEQHKEAGLKIRLDQQTVNGDVIVNCASPDAATSLIDYLASAINAYRLETAEEKIIVSTVNITVAEMINISDENPETVSDFEELKAAVESTAAGEERIIKIAADIEMEEIITVPQGAKVCITDDGTAIRTLSRQAGNKDSFFQTYYGTGLSLKGTEAGRLVLDGGNIVEAVKADSVSSLVLGRGTTVVDSVTFANSGSISVGINGAFINQSYGLLDINNSKFENGHATNGGAIYVTNCGARIVDTSFISNKAQSGGAIGSVVASVELLVGENSSNAVFEENSAERTGNSAGHGGAIRVNGGIASITGYTFKSNSATHYGGAIYTDQSSGKAIVTVTECKFGGASEGNTALAGGAIYNIGSSEITLIGNDKENSIFEENRAEVEEGKTSSDAKAKKGGAIYVSNGIVNVSGYKFTDNEAENGGAIYLEKRANQTNAKAKVTGSVFKNNSASANGGAIYNDSSNANSLTVENCTFGGVGTSADKYADGNKAVDGGAIYNNGTNPIIKDSKFENNKATGNGGAIYSQTGEVTLVNDSASNTVDTLFDGNTAASTGGAIYVEVGTLNVEGYTFNSNQAKDGGAVYVKAAENTTTLTGSTFTGNQATSGNGGAIYNASTKTGTDVYALTVTDCTFGAENAGNTAKSNGGAIYSESNNMKLMKSSASTTKPTFTSNRSNNYGGAVYLASGEINIDDVIFSKNTAKYRGGAVYMNSGTGTIDGSEFNNNSTDSQSGGAIYKLGELTISDTDFTSNKAGSVGGAINSDSANTTIRNCNFSSNSGSNAGAVQANGSGAKVTIEVTDSNNYLFSGNTASGSGGAIYVTGGAELILQKAENATGTLRFSGNSSNQDGGAIYVKSGDFNITGIEFIGNTTKANGGAICFATTATDDSLSITSSVFEENTASNWAGAIYDNAKSEVIIDSCRFGKQSEDPTTNPTKYGNKALYGGAILVNQNIAASLTIRNNSSFIGNKATTKDGGAIFAWTGSTMHITKTNFIQNVSDEKGGAIKAEGALIVTIDENCQFKENKTVDANNGNGGAIWHSKELIVKNSLFEDNYSARHGGAIQSEGGKLTVENVDFISNTSVLEGGACRVVGGCQAELKNGKFESNNAGTNGGAIKFNTGSLTIVNYTFTSNTASSGNAIKMENTTPIPSLSYCTFKVSDIVGKDGVTGDGKAYKDNGNNVLVTDN